MSLLPKYIFHWSLALAVLLSASVGAGSQSRVHTEALLSICGLQGTFCAQTVGTTAGQQLVTVTAQKAGVVNSVQVLTQGAPNLDFQAGSGFSCVSATPLALGASCSQSVTFTPAYPGPRVGAVVLLDSSGNVLGTTLLSGTGSGGIGVLVSGNVIPVAGTPSAWTLVLDGNSATNAELDLPSSSAFDGAGNMYIADSTHNRIRKVTLTSSCTITQGNCIITTIAGDGNGSYSGDGGLASAATLNSPSGVAVDGAGNIYIADSGNNVVREIAAATGIINRVAGNALATAGSGGDTGLATSAFLYSPLGVTLDSSGNLYIADTNNHRIRMVAAATGIITTVAGNGTTNTNGSGTYSGDGGLATSAGLNFPFPVAFDPAGNMYIPDSSNNRIRMVNPSGIISTFAGTGVVGYSGDGATAKQALLWSPSGVTVDPAGNVYIADTQNNAIRKVNSATGYISTLVRSGVGEYLLNGGFNFIGIYGPMGLSVDGNGNLFFADYFNMVIREVQGNFVAFDLTKTPVRQGDQSATQNQEIENDGNAALDLTSITPDSNAAVNATYTTCSTGTPLLAVAADCEIGAAFAPSPLNPPTDPETGNINIAVDTAAGLVATNSPLNIQLIGNATAVNSTTVVVTSNNNPSAFGQSVTFTATVSTGASSGNLTGTVTFLDGTATLASAVALNSVGTTATATFATSSLAVGLHSITASYSGDTGHFTSTSAVLVQTVGEATVTALVSSANPSAIGASVTFTATVTPSNGGSNTPDGTVVFSDGATILAGVALNASGVATFSTSTLTNGLHSITATYGGDAANQILGSSSPVLSQEVLAASSATLTSAPNPSYYGSAVTMTVTVIPSGAAAATGVVNILDSGMQIGQVTLVGTTGSGIFTTSSLAIGSHTITAAYQGSSFYAVSTSPLITQIVNQATTATTVSATPNPGIAGAAETLTATVTVTAGSGTPTGTVSFTDGATSLGSSLLGIAGTFTIKTTLAPGAHSIVATYSGDTNDVGSASAPYPLTVQLATTAVSTFTSTPNPSIADSAVTFTAKVTGNGGIPTGNINFVANGTSIGTANLDATGTATFAYSGFGAGTYSMVAIYSGDALDSTSTSAALSQVVGTIPTVTALGYSSTNGANPQVILVATVVASSGPPPTGTITFTSGSTTLGTAALDSSGVATLTPNLAVGSYSIVASYGGDVVHSPSTSPAVTISIPATGFSLAVTPASITLATSQNATVSVILTSNNGYTDTIELGCSSLPAGVTCHFASLSANLAANTVQTVQLTIDTNNPLSGGGVADNTLTEKRNLERASLFLPLSLFFGWIFWRFRKRNLAGLAMMLLLSCALLVTGCSGISLTGVPPGTYPIQVTGIGANSGISQYQNVTLTITK